MLSTVCQVQALGGAFGVKYPFLCQPSVIPRHLPGHILFDNDLNVYVKAEKRLFVTDAVEQGGATADPFIS